uniref:Biotin/lipoyl-binding protein n=1 Tax=Thermodesulfobacterium geofontis TaxID=1295609 RepID=A0A7C4NTR0_9BACT
MIKDKKRVGFFILIALALFFLSWLIYFLWHRYHYAVTDAVFVQADNLIYVSFPKVNGKLIKLYKNEGDLVKKGEILAEIESTDYALKVAQLEKALKEVENQQSALGFNIAKLEREIPLKSRSTYKTKG